MEKQRSKEYPAVLPINTGHSRLQHRANRMADTCVQSVQSEVSNFNLHGSPAIAWRDLPKRL
jgi:hypothetical protein